MTFLLHIALSDFQPENFDEIEGGKSRRQLGGRPSTMSKTLFSRVTIHIVSDVFILVDKIQLEKWNGDVLDVCRAARPYKIQPASRPPCVVRKRKEVGPQAPGDKDTFFQSSAGTTWHDPRSSQGDSSQLLLTLLRQ